MKKLARLIGIVGVAVLGLALGAGTARADHPARCTIRVIHAVDPGAQPSAEVKIDPKLDKLRPYLLKPPFSAWREFILLEKKFVTLETKTPSAFVLPNGKPASLSFIEHLPDEPGHPHRVRLQLQIGDPAHPSLNTVFVVDEGGVVLQAGQHYNKGLLILGTSCEQAH